MPDITWIIQENLANEVEYDNFINAIRARNIPHQIVKVVPFAHDLIPEVQNTNNLAFGSTTLETIARKRGWTPGSFTNDNHNVKAWFAGYGTFCLNHDGLIVKFGEIPEYTGQRFIRPLDDSKAFAGHVVSGEDLKEWQRCTLQYADVNSTLTIDTEVLVAPLKDIECEYRFFVVNGAVVAGSQYRERGYVRKRRINIDGFNEYRRDQTALDFARYIIGQWSPGENFVIDVCLTDELWTPQWKIVEINSLTSAGFYNSDTNAIVEALHTPLMKTINQINDTAERKSKTAAQKHSYLEPLRREGDGTIFGWRCKVCQGSWKIYQNPYHVLINGADCPHDGQGPEAL